MWGGLSAGWGEFSAGAGGISYWLAAWGVSCQLTEGGLSCQSLRLVMVHPPLAEESWIISIQYNTADCKCFCS